LLILPEADFHFMGELTRKVKFLTHKVKMAGFVMKVLVG
jgi:hypothetical protein